MPSIAVQHPGNMIVGEVPPEGMGDEKFTGTVIIVLPSTLSSAVREFNGADPEFLNFAVNG